WALMKAASVFVSLSDYEGCPNAVMEAMACGCPLVVSDIPAHREIVDQECAFLVEQGNARQAATAIIDVLRNSGPTQRRASNAKEKTRRWSVSATAKQYENLYKDIITA